MTDLKDSVHPAAVRSRGALHIITRNVEDLRQAPNLALSWLGALAKLPLGLKHSTESGFS